jgi:hypothetical protein
MYITTGQKSDAILWACYTVDIFYLYIPMLFVVIFRCQDDYVQYILAGGIFKFGF